MGAAGKEQRMGTVRGPTAVLRCDASRTIGGGHVVRCMALAGALAHAGWNVGFAVSDETPATVRELADSFGEPTLGFRSDGGDVARLRRAWPDGIDLLVVDHYGLDQAFERQARGWARLVLAIDDFPTRAHDCDILVDATFGREAAHYRALLPAGAAALCGSGYAMLREPFRRARDKPGDRHARAAPRILVAFGMTDSVNATGAALEGLAMLSPQIEATVNLGSGAPHLEAVAAAVARLPQARLVVDADAGGMAALIGWADLVIGAPGSASYERCCLGKPSLLIQLADNQGGNAAALAQAGAAELIGVWPAVNPGAVAHSVRRLLGDPDRLAAMSSAAASIVDGQGVYRIVAAAQARLV